MMCCARFSDATNVELSLSQSKRKDSSLLEGFLSTTDSTMTSPFLSLINELSFKLCSSPRTRVSLLSAMSAHLFEATPTPKVQCTLSALNNADLTRSSLPLNDAVGFSALHTIVELSQCGEKGTGHGQQEQFNQRQPPDSR